MLTQHLTMRASLSLTIVVMGLLGLTLALLTGEVYRQQTLDNQRAAMVDMLRLKTEDLLKELEAKSRDLALAIQHAPEFKRTFVSRDVTSLSRLMDSQFHQYFETANVIKLEKLRAYEINFSPITESSEGSTILAGGKNVCLSLIEKARSRRGPERVQTISDLCVVGDRLFHAMIAPIGGLRPTGYLQIVTDPIHNLSAIETALGMPVKITLVSGRCCSNPGIGFPRTPWNAPWWRNIRWSHHCPGK